MTERDTVIGAGRSAFESTQWGAILQARSGDAGAVRDLVGRMVATYWRPVYKYIRVAWSKGNEEAKDLTQDFFANVFQPEFLARADPSRGSFRAFLLASVKNFLLDAAKYRGAAKRGGGVPVIPIHTADEEALPPGGADPEEVFRRSWAESLLADALSELERVLSQKGRRAVFEVFKEYCLEPAPDKKVSYQSIALKLGLSVSDVTNYLSESRRELRSILLGKAGATLASAEEAERELRALFGA